MVSKTLRYAWVAVFVTLTIFAPSGSPVVQSNEVMTTGSSHLSNHATTHERVASGGDMSFSPKRLPASPTGAELTLERLSG